MIAFFLCHYRRRADLGRVIRYCAMNDFTTLIRADGGDWQESEILGNRAIVKVRASFATLQIIDASPGFWRYPLNDIGESLGTLTPLQRAAMRQRALDCGYPAAEFDVRFPDLTTAILGDILGFMCRRRLQPRYQAATDTIILDGPVHPCVPVDTIDQRVR